MAHNGSAPGADLVVVGDCNPDILVVGDDVAPEFGQREKLVDQISLVIGGSAAITAVAAARLGLRVALVAAVGDDPVGQFLLGQLTADGVDASAMAVRPGVPSGATVALSRGQDRAILTATAAMTLLTAADVPAALLAGAKHLHVGSYFLVERSLGPGLAELFARARAAGVTTSLDTNWDPSERWGGDQLAGILAETDVLVPNEAEALRISGTATLAEAVPVLTATGCRLAVKCGADGALCVDGPGGAQHTVVLPPVAAVDTTGAGDCFNAGLITGLLRGLDLPKAAALGCAVAAASTQALGGTGAALDLAAAVTAATAASIAQLPSPAGLS
jgi:sugar/nucleoside kinase (ribokinase family)